MKIVNLSEGLLTQGWMVSGLSPRITRGYAGLSATFFLKATFKLRHDELPVPWEKGPELISGDLMIDDDPSKGLGYASDYAPHKPQADFSAIGTAYPPPDDAPCFQVSMKVGTYSRQIQVWGERRFAKEVVGRSRAISEKPKPTRLSWDNAIGGPLSPLNPLGRGGDGLVMPLLEDPLHPTQNAPSKDILPAVFAPFPITSPIRTKKTGVYDECWIKSRWPWLPEDFDYTYYNAPDQRQWIGKYLEGDEELVVENMHPDIPVYKSRLPALRARCFVSRITNWESGLAEQSEQRAFVEVPMVLDTLWIDMDQQKLILVWRGATPCASLKMFDIEYLIPAIEPLNGSRPPEHYQQLWENAVAGTTVTPPSPEEMPAGDEVLGVSETKPFNSLTVDEIRGHGLENQDASNHDFSGMDLSSVNFRGSILRGAKFNNCKLIAADFTGADLAGADLTSADLSSAILDHCDLRKTLLWGALWQKCSLNGTLFTSVNLDGANFSGAKGLQTDFSKTSMRKASLNAAEFIQADFSGATLDDVNFSESKLASGNFRKVSAMRAILDGADITNIRASGANFSNARFKDCTADCSIWDEGNLDNSQFQGAFFRRSLFCLAKIRGADFDRSFLEGADFEDALLQKTNLKNCNLLRVSFARANLSNASLDGSNLYGADFWNAVLLHASWTNANVKRTRLEV
jgi:uncharacterized protein YjbI with pentapeptide repeats